MHSTSERAAKHNISPDTVTKNLTFCMIHNLLFVIHTVIPMHPIASMPLYSTSIRLAYHTPLLPHNTPQHPHHNTSHYHYCDILNVCVCYALLKFCFFVCYIRYAHCLTRYANARHSHLPRAFACLTSRLHMFCTPTRAFPLHASAP
jgi:hypothetical protein